jgi:hypothetical protein
VFTGLKKLLKIPGREKMLLMEALTMHLWIGLVLKVIPFSWIPRLFASPQFETPVQKETQSRAQSIGPLVDSRQSGEIELIKLAVQRAGRLSPWRNRCLVSSLAGKCMLRRRKIGSLLSLGVAKGPDGKTVAHAWLLSGENEIVERRGDYTKLFSF